jgi:superfamily II DNA or RNA helicase
MKKTINHRFQPGTLINCRKRLWRVDSQEENILSATAVDESAKQIKIYLPVEDVKPGNLPAPTSDEVGTPQAQKLMLDAFRLSMVNSTTPLRSLQFSRAIPVPYQLVPVAMALEQERVRLLIADDVGLGKTIEAGLVIQELRARGKAKKLLVICPASLREQWREALEYFFHIKAYVYSRENRRRLERNLPAGTNLLEFHDAFVVSVDYAKAAEIKNLLLDTEWDIVVIDEAHQVGKPHQSQPNVKIKKDRWQLAVDISISPKVKHLLLLTATPHNGYTDSFASLIDLLDVKAVSGPVHEPVIHSKIARKHIVQRRRSDVEDWLLQSSSIAGFPTRDQDEVIIRPSHEELETIKAVQAYGEIILNNAKDAQKRIRVLAGWAVLHLHKRALSSPEALRCSLRNRRNALVQRLEKLGADDPGLSEQDARANVLDEQVSDLFDEDEIIIRSEKVAPGSAEMIEEEIKTLDELIVQAKSITLSKDSKLQELIKNVLRELLRVKDKVIIFTKYKDTMNYVAKQLQSSERYSHVDVYTLDGSLNETQRYERFAEFAKSKKAVLVATDAISEGINLQHYSSQVIHYELPWNPNRLEQRNGRVDRFGQKEPVVNIRTLVLDETLDATILKVLVQKSNQIREDYGFSPPYFGDETNILDLIREHGMSVSVGTAQLSFLEEIEPPAPDEQDPFSEEVLERIKIDSFYGQSDLSLEFISEQITKTYETVGTPQAIQDFVFSGLNRFNCLVTENNDGTYKINIQHPDLLLPGIPSEIRRATFDTERGLKEMDIEVFDLGHPLIRRLIDLIKQEAFDQGKGAYGRTAAILTSDVPETTALLYVLVRFVTNTTPAEIFEDMVTFAIPVFLDQILSDEESERLMNVATAPGNLSNTDIQEILEEILARNDLDSLIEAKLNEREKQIIAERKATRESLQRDAEWLEKIEELSVGSWDLLAIKILWPA